MTKNPTVGDLLKQGLVTEDDVRAAVEALLLGPATKGRVANANALRLTAR
jgi:hypothetical protein